MSKTMQLKNLRSLRDLLQSDPSSTIRSVLHHLCRAQGSQGRQYAFVGEMLAVLHRIAQRQLMKKWIGLNSKNLGSDNGVSGFVIFRDGPGDETSDVGLEQQYLVKEALTEALSVVQITGSDIMESQASVVDLHCMDVRYEEVIRQISTTVWNEDGYGVLELPSNIMFENAKKVGDIWTDPTTGEDFEMDFINADDYDQVSTLHK
ncbi:hypothetical protein BC829DRAFT_403970 [Chytridium lagenaria]|nr:hypothetical protein BC829DRAFT_403970 [Chytridium lagenaria]